VTAFPEIREEAERLKQRLADRVNVTDSPDREKGISYSIKAGLRASGEADYYLFCVADQPWIRKETIQTLIQTTIRQQSVGGYVEWNGVSGNPAIFSRTLVPELLALEGDTGGKRILKGRDDICTIQAQEAAEMRDIDEKMQQ
jgi:molybdenum cofactor cytidylyltransferase